MTDTIEVPVELIKELHEYVDGKQKRKKISSQLYDLIRQLPRPEPEREPCQSCKSYPVLEGGGFWACSNDGCKVLGPLDDHDGSKWDAMARPARVLRELSEHISDWTATDLRNEFGRGYASACADIQTIINGGVK